ncbi:MAG: arsenosugar biosynthesis radical SAM (seleno)protein ArsS [Capsulimonas sp.]|uniref:arsenosugar biosynthesis radical SAM (seleno)protein ArsS n=1 Tax=Capsulimonas sp. TaxID=2494211 RepID=UPI0032663D4F
MKVISSHNFPAALREHGFDTLTAGAVTTLQVNVGKLCNQACQHCHVDAGPHRTEIMRPETAGQILDAVERYRIATVDITGGAPEMNPSFVSLVRRSRAAGAHVIVRHNLTIQFQPGYNRLPEFFRDNGVEVVASMPCYEAENTDAQRGLGVFAKSIDALRRLNAVGYGLPGSELALNLVHNPVGASLPPDQIELEQDYREELFTRFGIQFTHLYTITNMPISRFLHALRRDGQYEQYMDTLASAFNPRAIDGLMCRSMISVGWDGRLYDCDFNQMLGMGLTDNVLGTIAQFEPSLLKGRRIALGSHCFGCTAGAGSSCGGAVA